VTVTQFGMAYDDYIERFGPLFDDNSSHQCPCSCFPCSNDQPFWWLMLRWLKMILLNVARSYNAKPFVLVFAPLLVGIVVGYVLGRRQRFGSHERIQRNSSRWFGLQDMASLVCWQVGVWMAPNKGSALVVDKAHTFESIEQSHTSRRILPLPGDASQLLAEKEDTMRENLKSDDGMQCESGVDPCHVPRHVAVIMDGNRRYGKEKYGSVSQGHWDGSSKLVEFAKWCIAENISVLTVYAFSTENWTRDPSEVASLMAIFVKYSDELRVEALKRNIRIYVLSTDSKRVSAEKKVLSANEMKNVENSSLPPFLYHPIDTSPRAGGSITNDK
jgi:Putative undecaprenyl diphosphate synthase